jgi:hypothetical protein
MSNKSYTVLCFLLLIAAFCNGGSMANVGDSMNLNIGSEYSEFVDFVYDFSKSNRLNVDWYGWYAVDNPKEWYERSDTNFKIAVYLLAEENGYMMATSGFDRGSIKVLIDYGNRKPEWVEAIDKFKKAVADKAWLK